VRWKQRPKSVEFATWTKGESMFSHIMIGTNDLTRAKAFYDAVLGTLGVKPARVDGHRIFYRTPTGVFSVTGR